MNTFRFMGTMARAIIAGAVAFGTGLTAVLVGDTTMGQLKDGQWATICVGALAAFAGVWGITNSRSTATPSPSPVTPSTSH